MAPTASASRTWDASSKITTSNSMSGGRNCDTDMGLIMKHGLSCWAASPASPSRVRTGLCRVLSWACWRITPAGPMVERGRRRAQAVITSAEYSRPV